MWALAALIMGFAGSIHCAGMCGPIAVIVAGNKSAHHRPWQSALLYNSGRVLTYTALGSISGLVGHSVIWFAGQQWLSIIAGVIILAGLFLTQTNIRFIKKMTEPFYIRIRSVLGNVLRKRKKGTSLYLGLLNGLLPCGLVYAALGGAAATGTALSGAGFMFLFGAATIPVMLIISLAGSRLSPVFYKRMMKLVPVAVALMGALLILRGLGLGIPYLSPAMESAHVTCCHPKP
jgi:uncharacterized protein